MQNSHSQAHARCSLDVHTCEGLVFVVGRDVQGDAPMVFLEMFAQHHELYRFPASQAPRVARDGRTQIAKIELGVRLRGHCRIGWSQFAASYDHLVEGGLRFGPSLTHGLRLVKLACVVSFQQGDDADNDVVNDAAPCNCPSHHFQRQTYVHRWATIT